MEQCTVKPACAVGGGVSLEQGHRTGVLASLSGPQEWRDPLLLPTVALAPSRAIAQAAWTFRAAQRSDSTHCCCLSKFITPRRDPFRFDKQAGILQVLDHRRVFSRLAAPYVKAKVRKHPSFSNVVAEEEGE